MERFALVDLGAASIKTQGGGGIYFDLVCYQFIGLTDE